MYHSIIILCIASTSKLASLHRRWQDTQHATNLHGQTLVCRQGKSHNHSIFQDPTQVHPTPMLQSIKRCLDPCQKALPVVTRRYRGTGDPRGAQLVFNRMSIIFKTDYHCCINLDAKIFQKATLEPRVGGTRRFTPEILPYLVYDWAGKNISFASLSFARIK